MAKQKEQVGKYMEVWGDTVVPRGIGGLCDYLYLYFHGVLPGRPRIFHEPWYAGTGPLPKVTHCSSVLPVRLWGAFIAGSRFKPKRRILIDSNSEDIEEILKAAGMTVEEEREALRTVSPEIIREMENFELYSLLALIPEDSPNYKPEYREKARMAAENRMEET